jgi:hypothetical protein
VVVSRRDLQVALGVLWLIAAALQAQSFMFTTGFATQVIGEAAQGQPGFVSGPLQWASTAIAAHPVAWNLPFVAIQLLLGLGLIVPRTARLALAASIAWGLGVWYFGEGLSGIASGHASLITGAPGSALLLAVMAAAAWPRGDASREQPAAWLAYAWAAVWVGAAIFQLLPGQNTGRAVASTLRSEANGAPGSLARLDDSAAAFAGHHGALIVVLLVALELAIGLGALVRATMVPAVTLGLALTLVFWVLGQQLGAVYSGQATDLNSGPVLALMAVSLLALGTSRSPSD